MHVSNISPSDAHFGDLQWMNVICYAGVYYLIGCILAIVASGTITWDTKLEQASMHAQANDGALHFSMTSVMPMFMPGNPAYLGTNSGFTTPGGAAHCHLNMSRIRMPARSSVKMQWMDSRASMHDLLLAYRHGPGLTRSMQMPVY